MQKLINNNSNNKVAYVENIKDICKIKDLPNKKLCIVKTNFHDLSSLKKFMQKFPNIEFWLTSKDISRKNIIQANGYGIKNVLPYPFDIKVIRDFFRKNSSKISDDKYSCNMYNCIKGLNVMIVDDNQQNVELLVETISNAGLNIHTFTKPLEALEMIKHEAFDLFLLDVMMPEMSGFELAKEIKKTDLNKNSLIMFISAFSDAETKITGYDLGSCAYIDKPFDINVVRSQVLNMLKTKQLRDAMNKTRDSFVAMVAHDLKSPVNAEIRALELLLENTARADNSNNEIISDLLQAAKYMKNLVNNILYKYKFDNNCISLNKNFYSLKTIIEESIAEIKYVAAEKHQNITFSNKTIISNVFIDCLEIKRVLNNLLANSTEYAPHSSTIEIELSDNSSCLVVSVKNKIKGKAPENINEIFDKFVSFANSSKCVNSGLGLFVAKEIIEAHNGMINAELINDNFIKITFTIPKDHSPA